ncbi:MAG: DUF5667 domain-containing protein [Candidatus Woesearchaeota archaeon]
MKHLVYVAIAALLLIAAPIATAQNTNAQVAAQADVKVTPDSALYGAKIALEQVRTALTVRAESRADLHLRYADRRITEIEAMLEANNTQAAQRAADRYETNVNAAANAAANINAERSSQQARAALEQTSTARANLQANLARVAHVHADILARQETRMDEESYAHIQAVFENVQRAGLQADAQIESTRAESKQQYQVLAQVSSEEAEETAASISARTGLQTALEAHQNALAGLQVAISSSTQASAQAQNTLSVLVEDLDTSTRTGVSVAGVTVEAQTRSETQQESQSETSGSTSARADTQVTAQTSTTNTSAQAQGEIRIS